MAPATGRRSWSAGSGGLERAGSMGLSRSESLELAAAPALARPRADSGSKEPSPSGRQARPRADSGSKGAASALARPRADGGSSRKAGMSFDVRDAACPLQEAEPELPASRGCFPLHIFRWLPSPLRIFIPGTWQVIQDATHLSLTVGMLCLVFMGVVEILELAKGDCNKDFFCKFVCVVLLLLLILVYMIRTVGKYDQSIVDRENNIKEQREELMHGYEELVQDIDVMLNRATESTQSLAESEFNSKRNDFIRFLDRIEDRYETTTQIGTDAERAETLNSLKRFVVMWLKLYEECSLDPINKPFRIADPAQLENARTISELVHDLKARVKEKGQVYFSREFDESKKEIDSKRASIKCLSKPAAIQPLTWSPGASAASFPTSEIELSTDVRWRDNHLGSDSDGDLEAPQRSASGREVLPQKKKKEESGGCGCRWIKCGKSTCGPCCCANLARPFPRSFGCLCGSVIFLSPEHVKLIFGFFISAMLVCATVFQVFQIGIARVKGQEHSNIYATLLLVPSVGFWQALFFMLAWFEHIDIIQRMELELKQLQQESDALAHKKVEMVEYWEQVQAITDIWVYRVTPRLFLYKEVQACLEDLRKPGDFNKGLQVATTAIQALENQLPALHHWRADGTISEADKKMFDRRMKQISNNAQDLQSVVNNVNRLCSSRDAIPHG